jgi:hypothetical protein
MRIMLTFYVATIGTFGLSCDTLAQVQSSERAALLRDLSECRAIPDAVVRLACFDRTADALDTAERQGELVVMERQQIREARRQLFGFSAPALPTIFNRRDDGTDTEPEVASLETTLVSASRDLEGKWTFRLADGGEWRQIDSAPVIFQNRSGAEVRVRRATLGSYLLTAGNSRAVRVKRQ